MPAKPKFSAGRRRGGGAEELPDEARRFAREPETGPERNHNEPETGPPWAHFDAAAKPSKSISYRLNAHAHARLAEAARRDRRSIGSFMRAAVERAVAAALGE